MATFDNTKYPQIAACADDEPIAVYIDKPIQTVYRKMNTLEAIAHDAKLLNRAVNDIRDILGATQDTEYLADNMTDALLQKYSYSNRNRSAIASTKK